MGAAAFIPKEFISKVLEENPEFDGVHYSDLFEHRAGSISSSYRYRIMNAASRLGLLVVNVEVGWRECMACFLVNKGEAAPCSSDPFMRQLLGIFERPEW